MWAKFKASFRSSETILWSRLQVAAGVIGGVLLVILQAVLQVDLAPLFTDPRYLVAWLVVSGLLTELLRRHREDWGKDKQDGDDVGNHP